MKLKPGLVKVRDTRARISKDLVSLIDSMGRGGVASVLYSRWRCEGCIVFLSFHAEASNLVTLGCRELAGRPGLPRCPVRQ